MVLRFLFVLMAWLVLAVGARAAEASDSLTGPRAFTDVFGRSVVAELVSLGEKEVVLRRSPDGTEFTLPLDRLSDVDREFLADNRETILEKLTPLPETAFTKELRRDFRVLKRSRMALEPVPARMWTKTRYFVIVYGLPDSPEMTSELIRYISEEMYRKLTGRPVAVLWLGPSNANGDKPPPIPGGDLKVARVLPAGVAIIGVDAVARDGALVDAEIRQIATDESPENPNLFFKSGYLSRPEAVLAVWRKRVMARIPAYWPGCVYRRTFERPNLRGTKHALVVDREGKQAVGADGAPLEGTAIMMIGAAAALTDAKE